MHKNEIEDEDIAAVVSGHGRCSYLLASLIFLIFLYPFFGETATGEILLAFLNIIILSAGAYVVAFNIRIRTVAIGFAILAAAITFATVISHDTLLFRLSCFTLVGFYIFVIVHILHYVLVREPVTADKLHGAIAVYILMALLWAYLYSLVESVQPGSFSLGEHPVVGDPWRYYDLLFFSFSTLTTVGYGDIAPLSSHARMLSILEQLIGIFFVAVLISRLAGIYPPHLPTARKRARGSDSEDKRIPGE